MTKLIMPPPRCCAALRRTTAFLMPLAMLAGCMMPMDLTAHMTNGDVKFTGVLEVAKSGDGRLTFSAPDGPECDGLVVASTLRTPERLEGQIQCDDGRSGAIRMTISANQAVGSGRLGRDTITFRAYLRKAEAQTPLDPENPE